MSLALGLILLASTAAACSTEASAGCTPTIAPVDGQADAAAVCVAAELDSWLADRQMGVGQQLNVSSTAFEDPLKALAPQRPALVGFDLAELRDAIAQGNDPTDALVALAQQGTLLTATWHARNPGTGGEAGDRSWTRVADLLDPTTSAYASFWSSWDEQLANLKGFQDAGVAVILSPLHEAGGDWFWWGGMDPATYRAVWERMQQRAAEAGVHNLLWAFAAAPRTRTEIIDPLRLLPSTVDVVGIDTYQDTRASRSPSVDLTDYNRLAAQAPRMALTEVGPHGSDGSWTPSVITRTVRAAGVRPVYARLWFDDDDGRKAIASLKEGRQWLAGCPQGRCPLS